MHSHVWLSYPSFRRPQALYLQTQTRRYNLQVFPRLYRPNTLQYIRIQLVERKFVDFVVIHFSSWYKFFCLPTIKARRLAFVCSLSPPWNNIVRVYPGRKSLVGQQERPTAVCSRACVALCTCILLRRLEKLFTDIKKATSFTDVFPYK